VAVLALLLRSSLDAATAAADDIKCDSGWGQEERVIPSEWINDGYCDCPLDGLDEQGTEACSGSVVGGWAGVKSSSDARYVYILLSSVGLILELEAWSHFLFLYPASSSCSSLFFSSLTHLCALSALLDSSFMT
jgi:hypothetical protein